MHSLDSATTVYKHHAADASRAAGSFTRNDTPTIRADSLIGTATRRTHTPNDGSDMVDSRPSAPNRLRHRVGDRLSIDALAQAVRDALCGPSHAGSTSVVWEDRGSQMLMHVASLQVQTIEHALVVGVETETAEFGRAPLVVRFVFGSGRDPATLVASSDENVHGPPALAARWGSLFRDVVWTVIVRLADAHATERGLQARTISILGDHLRFTAEPVTDIQPLAVAHRNAQAGLSNVDRGQGG
jgi:hypothetical protein